MKTVKSRALLLHRVLEVPYVGEGPPFEPRIWNDSKARSLFSVHSLSSLFDDLDALLPVAKQMLQTYARIDWDLSPQCGSWIKVIDDNDARSTLFRYPKSWNKAADIDKSAIKAVTPDALHKRIDALFDNGSRLIVL